MAENCSDPFPLPPNNPHIEVETFIALLFYDVYLMASHESDHLFDIYHNTTNVVKHDSAIGAVRHLLQSLM